MEVVSSYFLSPMKVLEIDFCLLSISFSFSGIDWGTELLPLNSTENFVNSIFHVIFLCWQMLIFVLLCVLQIFGVPRSKTIYI